MSHKFPKSDLGACLAQLPESRHQASRFLAASAHESGAFRLTAAAEPSDYARCFHIFLAHTLKLPQTLPPQKLAADVRTAVRQQRRRCGETYRNKPFRQLLAFSLSALHLLGALHEDPLPDLVQEQMPASVRNDLVRLGCLNGQPGSGNQAMFMAIFLLHGRDYLGLKTQPCIDEWVEAHLKSMNRFGFWGPDTCMTHLQFQNGYHQYEVLEYLDIESKHIKNTLVQLRSLADPQGHFAPYPGGGGCYDYDAIFMLTLDDGFPDIDTLTLLLLTASTILSEQRFDGGFAESIYVRPRSWGNLRKFFSHTVDAIGKGPLFFERLRQLLTLQRPKHNRINTHWSSYSRSWGESDLWDTWFRLLTLARIDVALNPGHANDWGFIDYPGIGYHPALRNKN